ncbi:glucokinase regulatory protein [Salpingoeca rosetta]|uniref:Glucokinase regulatory protein n=1 Tax=Salpingoeca rosetta (strain ATCC 50818 / BSB-021) TaxID=946362 RepID=F2U045_SALR5|nr:glucokinase regulatory protein [Salpingoeca rosetta]EGD80773.1 glucokinase regulatory protein [Salpingoeca rosetta]|eukprot:XP_004997334.1 glucokinase regulatory protein [Salpingoeca rosetta]
MSKSVTETSNELTDGLDMASPEQIVRLLRQADAQMFSGWREFPGINDTSTIDTMAELAEVASTILAASPHTKPARRTAAKGQGFKLSASANTSAKATSPMTCVHSPTLAASVYATSRVVITGSGTSGRMAFFICRAFNEMMLRSGRAPCFEYLHAGEDPALFVSREAPEDNWQLAQRRLAEVMSRSERIMLVGITCGLSAPFVASQLEYAMGFLNSKVHAVALLGFNPVERARNAPVEGWHRTVADVVQEMARRRAEGEPCFILNPVVGPEAVTGSTRMKGGSATKFLLEIVFERAFVAMAANVATPGPSTPSTPETRRRGSRDCRADRRTHSPSPARATSGAVSSSSQETATVDSATAATTTPTTVPAEPAATAATAPTAATAEQGSSNNHHTLQSILFPFLRRHHQQHHHRHHQRHHHRRTGSATSSPDSQQQQQQQSQLCEGGCLGRASISALLMNYEAAVRATYLSLVDIATVVAMGAEALSKGGHIYYLGRNSYGLAAVIDASECQPTYNARFEDVRAFLCGGYATLRNVQGDLSSHSRDFRLGWCHFGEDIVPTLTSHDLVVVVDGAYTCADTPAAMEDEKLLPSILTDVKAKGAALVAAVVGDVQCKATSHPVYASSSSSSSPSSSSSSPVDEVLQQELSSPQRFDFVLRVDLQHVAFDTLPIPVFAEIAMKLVLNAITTGAFVLTGKVMKNRMIDLQVSNNKLFFRSLGIIQEFSGVSETHARTALLRSIYDCTDVSKEVCDAPISQHIRSAVAAAQAAHRVVPTAVVLASQPDLSPDAARKLLAAHPIVAHALSELN